MNQVVLIGKLKTIGSYFITIEVSNREGSQLISVEPSPTMLDLIQENGHIDGVVGVKGSIDATYELKIKAEKVSFLSWK